MIIDVESHLKELREKRVQLLNELSATQNTKLYVDIAIIENQIADFEDKPKAKYERYSI
jgi:hypothetical protein